MTRRHWAPITAVLAVALALGVAAHPGGGGSMRGDLLTMGAGGIDSPLPPVCTTIVTTLSGLTTAVTGASGGDTICLNWNGYLGEWTAVTQSSPGITITPAAGATPALDVDASASGAWLTFDGVDFGGQAISGAGDFHQSTICGPANHLTFKNATAHDDFEIYPSTDEGGCSATMTSSQAILFDNVDFTASDTVTFDGSAYHEGRVQIMGGQHAQSDGVTIQNSVFEAGCQDGIQSDGAGGTVVTGTTFHNIKFDTAFADPLCGSHPDAIQYYCGANGGGVGSGCGNLTIQDSYFYDDQVGVVDYDSQTEEMVITNTVFDTIPPATGNTSAPCDAICLHSGRGLTVDHVTMYAAGMDTGANNDGGTAATGWSITNSIMESQPTSGTFTARDHNLCTVGTCTGTGSLNGSPTYVGGSHPSVFANWALTSGSLGHAAASDSADIGVNP